MLSFSHAIFQLFTAPLCFSDEGNQTNDRTLELHSKNSRHLSAACDKLRPAVITDILCSSGECKLAQSVKRLEKTSYRSLGRNFGSPENSLYEAFN